MKFFIALMLFAVVATTLPGCSTARFQPSGDCLAGDSLILSTTGGQPAGLDRALLMINFGGLESDLYTKEQVIKFFDEAETLVRQGVSYIDLVSFLSDNVEQIKRYAGLSVVLLGADVDTIGRLGGAATLSACDASLVKTHLANQRRLLVFF